MQLTELAQDTPTREPTPAGAASVLQPVPPSVVVKMVVPATAVHVDELMQLREANVDATGVPRSFHVVPPSEVLITCGPDGHTRRVARTRDGVEARHRRENSWRLPGGATIRGAEDRRTGTDRGRTDCGAIRRADAGDRGEVGDRIWERLGRPRGPAIGRHNNAWRRGAKVAHGVTSRCADTRHRCQNADTGRNGLRYPGKSGVSRTDGDGAPKDAEANRRTVGCRRTGDSVEAADLSRDRVRAPCVAGVDRGEDRVHPGREAVGRARARNRVQATDARRRRLGDPGLPACRRRHDRRTRSRVPTVSHRDAVVCARARDPREIDCIRWRILSRPCGAVVRSADYVGDGAEIGADGDAGVGSVADRRC